MKQNLFSCMHKTVYWLRVSLNSSLRHVTNATVPQGQYPHVFVRELKF